MCSFKTVDTTRYNDESVASPAVCGEMGPQLIHIQALTGLKDNQAQELKRQQHIEF